MKTNNKIVEQKLSKNTLATREKIMKDLMKNKSSLVKRYGKDAEKVMYGRSTNIAKKIMNTQNKQKIRELVKNALMNEVDIEVGADRYEAEQDLTQTSNLLDEFEMLLKNHDWYYEMSDDHSKWTRGNKQEETIKSKMKQLSSVGLGTDAQALYDRYNPYNKQNESFPDLTGDGKVTRADILKGRGVELDEDLDVGHTDNEPHMLKADLYRIGKYAMELYQMVGQFEYGHGEVDFPHWWQSKIVKAKELMVSAKHYLDFETKEPEIDAMLDATEEAGTFDNVGVTKTQDLAERILAKLKNR